MLLFFEKFILPKFFTVLDIILQYHTFDALDAYFHHKIFPPTIAPQEKRRSTFSGVVTVHFFINSIHLYYGHKPAKLFISWNCFIITGIEEVECLEIHNFAFKYVNCQGWRCILTVTIVLVPIRMGVVQTVSKSDCYIFHQRRIVILHWGKK